MDLDAQKKALLELLLEEEGFSSPSSDLLDTATIARRAAEQPCPLSFAQQRLWVIDQMEPGNPAYNVPGVLTVAGELNIAALTHSVAAIVTRHAVLRTHFTETDAGPVQTILDQSRAAEAFRFEHRDLSAQPETDQQVALKSAIRQATTLRFDLSTGPLLHIELLSLSTQSHYLLFTLHHIVCDEQSLSIIAEELKLHYTAQLDAAPNPLPELGIQYDDFSAWQHSWALSDAYNDQVEYWTQQLAELNPTELPIDRPRPTTPSYVGQKIDFCIPQSIRSQVEQLAQANATTPFIVLIAAFKHLLYRYTNQGDLSIGTPVANRDKAQTEKLIGFFTNTLVIRSTARQQDSFQSFLEQVKKTCTDAYAHQDIPFEALVESLQPDRALNRNPLFELLFVLQKPFEVVELPGATLELLTPDVETIKFDLTFTLKECPDGYIGWIEYNTDIFEAPTIDRFAGHFSRLLEQVVQNPGKSLHDYDILSPDETDYVLNQLNATKRDYSTDQLIHQVFEQQAAKNPTKTALTYKDQRISYEALNQQSNQLAHYLAPNGIGPDIPVGICLERSITMIVAVLAVLKAGGTYLPLDPAYPKDRLRYMLEDSQAPLLLINESSNEVFDHTITAQKVSLDAIEAQVQEESIENLDTNIHPLNLLYLIYTSGSTGKAKGTGLSHYALRNLILWHWEHLATPATTLQFASLSFDASFHEIFIALGAGSTLVIASEEERQDIDQLIDCLNKNGVEKTILPVGIFQQWAAEYATRACSLDQLKEIITTGEQLIVTPPMAELLQKIPHCSLHNHYGPSETHVITAYPFDGLPADFTTPPPIGKPLANTQIYILDPTLKPTAPGAIGQLYAGGANLARGYHNRPDLTAERFIPSPFSQNGERLYDTGDIARYLPDGNIEFLGRKDDQLKIRGFRVEPGEVESTLTKHPEIQQAVIVGLELQQNRKSLVAYYTTKDNAKSLNSRALRSFVSSHLPDYMVPSRFIALAAMPLTPSGKIDRRALPEHDQDDQSNDQKRLPSCPAEQLMLNIWKILIETEQIGVDENFFDLGGHSLLATRVISRVRNEFGLPVELKNLFEYPTIESFIQQLAKDNGGIELINEIAELSLNFDSMTVEERHALLSDLN